MIKHIFYHLTTYITILSFLCCSYLPTRAFCHLPDKHTNKTALFGSCKLKRVRKKTVELIDMVENFTLGTTTVLDVTNKIEEINEDLVLVFPEDHQVYQAANEGFDALLAYACHIEQARMKDETFAICQQTEKPWSHYIRQLEQDPNSTIIDCVMSDISKGFFCILLGIILVIIPSGTTIELGCAFIKRGSEIIYGNLFESTNPGCI